MDWDGKVESPRMACAATGAPLPPGSRCCSGLRLVEGLFARLDYTPEAWATQDPTTFLAWWQWTVPQADRPLRRVIDADALMRIFQALLGSRERQRQCFLYVVCLFLMRARRLRFRETVTVDGITMLVVEERARGLVHRVRDPAMTPEDTLAVESNLREVVDLGLDLAPGDDVAPSE